MKVIFFCKPEIAKNTHLYASATIQRHFAGSVRIQTVESKIDTAQLRKLIGFWQPIGAIVAASSGYGVFTKRNLKSIPTVYLDPPTVSSSNFNVTQDNEADARAAAMELLSHDMKHYAFVSGPKTFRWSAEREKSFTEGIRASNLSCSSFKRNLPEGDYLKELANWLRDIPKPCGIFADNDKTAEKIVNICTAVGISIPEEVKLVGCDNDLNICEKASITISSVCPDYENATRLCADLLDQQIQNPKMKPCTIKYGVNGLIRRASSSRILKYDRRVAAALKIIHGRIHQGITVSDIASELNCSIRVLQMKFKSTTGLTIKNFISDVRMEKVKSLLKTTSIPVESIAKTCGYGTNAALRTAFLKRHGMSMNEWRKLNNGSF